MTRPDANEPDSGPSSAQPLAAQLGWWALIAIFLVAGTVLYTDLLRLMNPVGEKYLPGWPPGQNDFNYPYVGARALLEGVNPYVNDRPEFTSPIFGIQRIGDIAYKQLYPPGHLLLYVPLAWWKGTDWVAAARVWYHVCLVSVAALAVFAWRLTRRVTELRLTAEWIILFGLCMLLSPGVELGIERGQSDIAMALFCWGALLAYTRRHHGTAIFLAICGASIKGYPVLFTAGLGLLALRRRTWPRALLGGALATALMVVPVAPWFRDAAVGVRFRSEMFWPDWCNHSFLNAVYQIAPSWSSRGRLVLTIFALCVTVAAWIQARRASTGGSPAAQAFWLITFTLASLGTVLGYSGHSVSYNSILLLPGVLILAASQERVATMLALPRWAAHLLGVAVTGSAFLLFIDRLGTKILKCGDWQTVDIPAAAYGLLGLFAILAALVARALVRPVTS